MAILVTTLSIRQHGGCDGMGLGPPDGKIPPSGRHLLERDGVPERLELTDEPTSLARGVAASEVGALAAAMPLVARFAPSSAMVELAN